MFGGHTGAAQLSPREVAGCQRTRGRRRFPPAVRGPRLSWSNVWKSFPSEPVTAHRVGEHCQDGTLCGWWSKIGGDKVFLRKIDAVSDLECLQENEATSRDCNGLIGLEVVLTRFGVSVWPERHGSEASLMKAMRVSGLADGYCGFDEDHDGGLRL